MPQQLLILEGEGATCLPACSVLPPPATGNFSLTTAPACILWEEGGWEIFSLLGGRRGREGGEMGASVWEATVGGWGGEMESLSPGRRSHHLEEGSGLQISRPGRDSCLGRPTLEEFWEGILSRFLIISGDPSPPLLPPATCLI